MEIKKTQEGSALTVAIIGRLDTNSSPQLEEAVFASLEGITDLTFDIHEMPYTSSAGLRVFLKAQKAMNVRGTMRVIGATEDVKEIFDITGFADIIDIE